VKLKGDKGGAAKIVLPNDSPNAWWAELWRVVPSMRPRLERAKPEVLGVVARAEARRPAPASLRFRASRHFQRLPCFPRQAGEIVASRGGTCREQSGALRLTLDRMLLWTGCRSLGGRREPVRECRCFVEAEVSGAPHDVPGRPQ
jgi:hypothetical protein